MLGDRITVLDDMTRGMFLATKANGAALRHPQHGRLSYDCFMQTADEHLAEFKRDGLTLFPKMLDAAWAREMRDAFEQIADSDRDEVIVFPQAGDVALFHGSMLP